MSNYGNHHNCAYDEALGRSRERTAEEMDEIHRFYEREKCDYLMSRVQLGADAVPGKYPCATNSPLNSNGIPYDYPMALRSSVTLGNFMQF